VTKKTSRSKPHRAHAPGAGHPPHAPTTHGMKPVDASRRTPSIEPREFGFTGAAPSIGIAVAFFAASLVLAARSPISGDGAELVATAVHGGVLHPPGFPLGSWIDRIVVALPLGGTAAFRLSVFSALCHAVCLFVLERTGYAIGLGVLGRFACAGAFVLFAPIFALGTQPEVFALAHLLIVGLVAQAVAFSIRTVRRTAFGPRDAVALGSLVGLAASQHPIAVLAAPAFLVSLVHLALLREGRVLRISLAALSFAFVAGSLYASLPLLAGDAVWPNWGPPRTASAIVHHLLRSDFGTIDPMRDEATETFRGIRFFGREVLSSFHVLLFVVPFGAGAIANHRARVSLSVIVFGTLALGLAFLAYAEADSPRRFAEGILERFDGPAALGVALVLGAGVDAVARGIVDRRLAELAGAIGVALLALVAYRGATRADASGDDTADVLRHAMGATFPEGAVYLAHEDLEGFQGIELEDRTIRYPILRGLLELPWYVARVVPALEPRLDVTREAPLGVRAILDDARAKGLTVASTNQLVVSPDLAHPSQLRGFYFVAGPGIVDPLSWETVDGAAALCPHASRLRPLPERGFFSARQTRSVLFGRAFERAAVFLDRASRPDEAARAREVHAAFVAGTDPSRWNHACRGFVRAVREIPADAR